MARRDDVDRLQDEIEELFDELWQVPSFAGLRRGFRPQVDVYRTEGPPPALTVVVELPGVAPEDVEIVVRGQDMLIQGVRRRPSADKRAYSRVEIEHGEFQRRVALGEDVDTTNARTSFERGVLTIILPVAERRPPPVMHVTIEVRPRR